MPRRWLLTIVAVVIITLIALRPELRSQDRDTIEPQTFTLTTGGTRTVGEGRAQVWLSSVRRDYPTAAGDVVAAAEVEVTCRGETFTEVALLGRTSTEFCGCRLRLLEVIDTTPMSARFEVLWKANPGRDLQSASQFAPPRRKKAISP